MRQIKKDLLKMMRLRGKKSWTSWEHNASSHLLWLTLRHKKQRDVNFNTRHSPSYLNTYCILTQLSKPHSSALIWCCLSHKFLQAFSIKANQRGPNIWPALPPFYSCTCLDACPCSLVGLVSCGIQNFCLQASPSSLWTELVCHFGQKCPKCNFIVKICLTWM